MNPLLDPNLQDYTTIILKLGEMQDSIDALSHALSGLALSILVSTFLAVVVIVANRKRKE